MPKAIKHIKAGLLHVEVIGNVPERAPGRRRAGRCRPTSAAQQFYNNKCSWRELELIFAANFAGHDYVVTCTYGDGHLPPDKTGADKCFQKFVRRLRAVRRKRGETRQSLRTRAERGTPTEETAKKQELRYVYVTEGCHGRDESSPLGADGRLEDRRLHHHVVLNGYGAEDLEELQSLWPGGGYVRVEPVDVHYYRELAKYLTKEPRELGRARPGEHAWRASRNLRKYEVEYIEIPSDSVTLSPPPGAVDYTRFNEKNPYGYADCVGARYLLFPQNGPPGYSYAKGRKTS